MKEGVLRAATESRARNEVATMLTIVVEVVLSSVSPNNPKDVSVR